MKTIGYSFTGSYCTFEKSLSVMKKLSEIYNIIPIVSEKILSTDTRFYKSEEFKTEIEKITKNKIIHTINEAEPIGPKKLLDLLVISLCTGNTLAKLTQGITDSSVTMAYKAHMRNNRPVLIGISTNDALSTNAKNIGILLNRKNVYFIPFGQDDPLKKPFSMISDFNLTEKAITYCFENQQMQPLII